MKKILLFTVCAMLFAVSCDNENLVNNQGGNTQDIGGNGEESENDDFYIIDGLPSSPHFAIIDENNEFLLTDNPELIEEIEVVFDGISYTYNNSKKYNDETRALNPLHLGVYKDGLYGYTFWVGHLHVYDKGSFAINFRDQHWEIEFDYEWGESPYVAPYTLTIDGEPSEEVEVCEVMAYWGHDEEGLVTVTAYPLRFK